MHIYYLKNQISSPSKDIRLNLDLAQNSLFRFGYICFTMILLRSCIHNNTQKDFSERLF